MSQTPLTLRERSWLTCNDLERLLKRLAMEQQIDPIFTVRTVDDLRRILMEMAERIEALENDDRRSGS